MAGASASQHQQRLSYNKAFAYRISDGTSASAREQGGRAPAASYPPRATGTTALGLKASQLRPAQSVHLGCPGFYETGIPFCTKVGSCVPLPATTKPAVDQKEEEAWNLHSGGSQRGASLVSPPLLGHMIQSAGPCTPYSRAEFAVPLPAPPPLPPPCLALALSSICCVPSPWY